MTTVSRVKEFWCEVKRVVTNRHGERVVQATRCCCALPGGRRADCSLVNGTKGPCRCHCHSGAHKTSKPKGGAKP